MDPVASSITVSTIFFCITLVIRAIFSFLETSITALRLFKLKELAKSAKQYKTLFYELETHPHRVLMTILIANIVDKSATLPEVIVPGFGLDEVEKEVLTDVPTSSVSDDNAEDLLEMADKIFNS